MKTFQRTVTKTFTPKWVHATFSIYNENWIRIRSRMKYKASKCFRCRKPFEINEVIGLVCLQEIGNKVMCQACCSELLGSETK